ncbi:universal stress protein [Halobium salinum]|uniref:Universal stress protein n=1 Tax=Halobium salinum TaxID=1364940 RepID=A0ABD5P9F7_9EURY|nr:universal stress protein [Halobium salinum]
MTRVLVPLAVLEGESVSLGLMNLLGTVDVTVLGYHVLPEQTPPDQARLQYEKRANETLADVVEEFRLAGGAADSRLVFTPDRTKTIRRVADEVGAAAYTIKGATGAVERLLVPLSGDVDVDRVLSFVVDLVADRDIGVTLLLVTDDESEGRRSLDEAEATLAERGLDVRTELVVGGDPFDALVDASPSHEAVVMGEQAPSLRSSLLGEETDRAAAESVSPVLVVRRDPENET